MNPKFWGPHAWIFLHSITMNYPKEPTEKDKLIYVNFFKELQNILPCEKCAYNYKRHLEDYPIEEALGSREAMIQWLINIHNEVNKELDKPIYTYDQVIEEYRYKMFHLDRDPTMVYKIIIVLLIICVGYLVYKKR
tara:strand:- start:195 stop:602 length:408 start_codon:yes stop_codon:yes gene_type:complete